MCGDVTAAGRGPGPASKASRPPMPPSPPLPARRPSPPRAPSPRRRSPRPGHRACPPRAAPPRPHRARARRALDLPRLRRLSRLGRRPGRRGRRRGPALAHRRRALPRPGRADGGRRDPRAAARAPGRTPLPGRRAVPVRRAHARPRRRHARDRPGRRRPGSGTPTWVKPRGGMVGEGLYWVTSTLLSTSARTSIAVFLFTRRRAAAHGRLDRRRRSRPRATRSRTTDAPRSRDRRPRAPRAPRPRSCRAPGRRAAAARRAIAAHVWSGHDALPDLLGDAERARADRRGGRAPHRSRPSPTRSRACAEDPETDEPGVARTAARPRAAHPAGPLPREVTESPDFEWTIPDTAFLKRSSAEASRGPTRPGRRRSPPS